MLLALSAFAAFRGNAGTNAQVPAPGRGQRKPFFLFGGARCAR
jgi:hypothetical protein